MLTVFIFCTNDQKQRRERYLAQQQGGVDSAWNLKTTKTKKCVYVFLFFSFVPSQNVLCDGIEDCIYDQLS